MAEPSVPQGLKNQAEIAILPYVLYNCVIPAKNTIRGENTMNKTELIAAMAETSGLSKKDRVYHHDRDCFEVRREGAADWLRLL